MHAILPLDLGTVENPPLDINTSSKQQVELKLQKYIQMLLDKWVENHTDDPELGESQEDKRTVGTNFIKKNF